jgi:hypothetical protein
MWVREEKVFVDADLTAGAQHKMSIRDALRSNASIRSLQIIEVSKSPWPTQSWSTASALAGARCPRRDKYRAAVDSATRAG